MGELLVTFLLIGLALLWVLAWRYQRRFAVGTVVGAVIAVLVAWLARPFELRAHPALVAAAAVRAGRGHIVRIRRARLVLGRGLAAVPGSMTDSGDNKAPASARSAGD